MVDSTNNDVNPAHLFSVKARAIQPAAPVTPPTAATASSSDSAPLSSKPFVAPAAASAQSDGRIAQIMYDARREFGKVNSGKQGTKPTAAASHEEEEAIAAAIDKTLKQRGESMSDVQRADLIIQMKQDLSGWGLLQKLIEHPEVTDIHCYDHKTVVIQRGKESEVTGLQWNSHHQYTSFIDRLLLSLDRSMTTQQHTIDVSLANGTRICAVHESVCGTGGPYLSIRVPRVVNANIDTIISGGMAPKEIVQYLGALTKSGVATMIIAGETGTGKTTLLRCLATLFGPKESIVSVEDTPEINCQHRFFRCLVSRPANLEGVGEVTLQEHIQATLRMTPTRVILGEMRSPFAAEAFLESAQTGHVGMSTVHARNAKETLVRLESLLGRAQKSVSVDIIRQQIALAVDVIIWLFREKSTGKPRIGEIIEVTHYVEGQIQIRPMFTYRHNADKPTWVVESWTSKFDTALHAQGVAISSFPAELHPGSTTFARNAG